MIINWSGGKKIKRSSINLHTSAHIINNSWSGVLKSNLTLFVNRWTCKTFRQFLDLVYRTRINAKTDYRDNWSHRVPADRPPGRIIGLKAWAWTKYEKKIRLCCATRPPCVQSALWNYAYVPHVIHFYSEPHVARRPHIHVPSLIIIITANIIEFAFSSFGLFSLINIIRLSRRGPEVSAAAMVCYYWN